jgi:hypothetical protein
VTPGSVLQVAEDTDDDIHSGAHPHRNANRLPRPMPAQPVSEAYPLVSIVLPVFNAAEHLDECLRGISLQTHRPLELSVCNNNSTDGSAAILQQWQPRLEELGIAYKCKTTGERDGQGCGLARNRAIDGATGAPCAHHLQTWFKKTSAVSRPGNICSSCLPLSI